METKKDSLTYKIIERDIETNLIYRESNLTNHRIYNELDVIARTERDQQIDMKIDMVMDSFINYFVEEAVQEEVYSYEL